MLLNFCSYEKFDIKFLFIKAKKERIEVLCNDAKLPEEKLDA